jgi:hypothetical protein
LRIIRNEKYCGDLIQKKTFTPCYLSHEKRCNRGEEDFIIIRNHHEPIISRKVFEKANEILESRAINPEGKAKYSNRYAFSGKIKCGICDVSYAARNKVRKNGEISKNWRCYNRGCTNDAIKNDHAVYIMGLVVRSLHFNKDLMIRNLLHAIGSVLRSMGIKEIEKNLRDMINGTCSDDAFYRGILNKMVVHKPMAARVDVYLHCMEHKWVFVE